ncbi:glycerol kinase [Anopheles bellator]|uniref:glycerol kinase n=1 Tax=Anopheles bellator TaxID=139047 RepID=UPI0026492F4F|nr:glycerol kinase [Anopheles bellator]
MSAGNRSRSKFGSLIGVLYVGHTSCKFLIYATRNAEILTCHELPLQSISPQSGWIEFEPLAIWEKARSCLENGLQNLIILDINPLDIVAIGVCNQRETTVLWDRTNGEPLCNAIGWCDTRTSAVVGGILQRLRGKKNFLKSVCGLPFSNCFCAVKLRWMIENVDGVQNAIDADKALFGTLDSWIIWLLTGGVDGGIHVTDVTNASRTMLMNLETCEWDERLCRFFRIPNKILPEIRSCSEVYGYINEGPLSGIPIASCLGDQQAALLGQMCLKAGHINCTVDEGMFILFNTAQEIIDSDHGLLSTVAYQLGARGEVFYALEGAIAHAGSSISWLKRTLALETPMNDSMHTSSSTGLLPEGSTAQMMLPICSPVGAYSNPKTVNSKKLRVDVIFVPAFSGYYSPYWRYKARGMMFGITLQTTPQQILFAAHEAICYQVREVLEALAKDCPTWPRTKLTVGGDLSEQPFLVQMLSDLNGLSIERPQTSTPACLGTMLAAGLATEVLSIDQFRQNCVPPIDVFNTAFNSSQRDMKFRRWKMAVDRCLNFDSVSESDPVKLIFDGRDPDYYVRCAIPGSLFFISSFALIVISEMLLQNGIK